MTGGETRRVNTAPTILLVDDDAPLRVALSSVLTALGYRVLTAATSESAYSMVASSHVDAIVLDVRLPTMSGLALYTVIVNRWPQLRGSIAFLTSAADDPDVRPWLEAERCTVFRKPCPVGDVTAWVGLATRTEHRSRASS